jgi:CubicO group peptidase (beta-lactamase class C family)
VPREELARRVDALFSDKDSEETRSVIVMKGGRVIAERYAPGYHENTRFVSWSMAKSITGVMIGMLISDGRLRLDEPAPIPAGSARGTRGRDHAAAATADEDPASAHAEAHRRRGSPDEVRMLFLDGRDAMARYAEDQPLQFDPGRKWVYSTATSVILADLAARVLSPAPDPESRRRAVADYLRTRLFDPVGMRSMVPEFDASGDVDRWKSDPWYGPRLGTIWRIPAQPGCSGRRAAGATPVGSTSWSHLPRARRSMARRSGSIASRRLASQLCSQSAARAISSPASGTSASMCWCRHRGSLWWSGSERRRKTVSIR